MKRRLKIIKQGLYLVCYKRKTILDKQFYTGLYSVIMFSPTPSSNCMQIMVGRFIMHQSKDRNACVGIIQVFYAKTKSQYSILYTNHMYSVDMNNFSCCHIYESRNTTLHIQSRSCRETFSFCERRAPVVSQTPYHK